MMARVETEYPPGKAIAEQLAALYSSIIREERRVGQSTQNQYRDAVQRETALADRVEDLKSQMVDLRRRNIEYNIFQRDVDTNRELYNGQIGRASCRERVCQYV